MQRVTPMRSFNPTGMLEGKSKRAASGGGRQGARSRSARGSGGIMGGLRREFPFDMHYLAFLLHMFDTVPGFQFGRRSMQARLFCERFKVVFKNWPTGYGTETLMADEEFEKVIERWWMPQCKRMFDFYACWGFFPYVWRRIPGQKHWYPVLPKLDTFVLTYEETRFGTLYRLYWVDEIQPEEAPEVFFEVSDQEPEKGVIRTAVASLARDFRLYLANVSAHLDLIPSGANPHHLFEHHPKATGDLEELHATRLVSTQESALSTFYRKEQDLTNRDFIRRGHLDAALKDAYNRNYGGHRSKKDTVEMRDLQRTHGKFLSRATALNSDYTYKAAQTGKVVLPLTDIWLKLNRDAANALGFPIEFAQSQSSQRSSNVEGNVRYVNENVKDNLRTWSRLLRHMITVGPYGRIVHKINELGNAVAMQAKLAAKDHKKGKKEKPSEKEPQKQLRIGTVRPPSERFEFQLIKAVDVDVVLMCTPEMSYQQLRQLVIDEVMDHTDFVKHAADMFGLPKTMLRAQSDGKLPEQVQLEISQKDAKQRWKLQNQAPAGQPGGGGRVPASKTPSASPKSKSSDLGKASGNAEPKHTAMKHS